MPKVLVGDLCADLGPKSNGQGRNYTKIGSVYQDGDRLSVKIDTLPLPGWGGWANVFPKGRTHNESAGRPPDNHVGQFDESDIPF